MKYGKVIKITEKLRERTKVVVLMGDREELAINYNSITGNIQVNDKVLLNTTAIELNLGTGGYHFVMYNYGKAYQSPQKKGHIMKCRYTPFQLRVMSAEEENSPYNSVFHNFRSLDNFPVLVGSLHSMLMPAVATLKYLNSKIKIAYIMTDAGSLPIYFSDSIYQLKYKKLLDTTITVGHAFGGDLETVNIYNGIIAAKEVAKCDIAIVSMGPGVVGTGTPYGFTGIEQGNILDIVNDLGGLSIGIPRISFAEKRLRHQGVSHHSLTVFGKVTKTKCQLIFPSLKENQRNYIFNQIESLKINHKHNIIEIDGKILSDALYHFDLTVNTMGRNYDNDPSFFLTCSAAALYGFGKL